MFTFTSSLVVSGFTEVESVSGVSGKPVGVMIYVVYDVETLANV